MTARRVLASDAVEAKLRAEVFAAMSRLSSAYKEFRQGVPMKKLQLIARPIKRTAATFRRLVILDELFLLGTSEAVFAAAVILQIRRDPAYMEKLITFIDDPNIRGSARWRVLRAIRDSIASYEFTPSGIDDLTIRLQNAIAANRKPTNAALVKGTNLHMIAQIAKRLKIDSKALFEKAGRVIDVDLARERSAQPDPG